MYAPTKVYISHDQHERLKKAVQHGKAISVKVTINEKGQHTLLLTHLQRKRLERAKLMKKGSITIKLSKKQVEANVEHKGGFIATLLGLASKVLPTLLGGLATGLISGGIEKAISGSGVHNHQCGNGLYLHKSGHSVKIIPIRGRGVQLLLKKLKGVSGDGLYLKHGANI